MSIAQHDVALAIGNERRKGQAELRVALRSGSITFRDVLGDAETDPHPLVTNMALVDVLRLARRTGRCGAMSMETIGREAVHAGVNLLVLTGRASVFSRTWAAERGNWHCRLNGNAVRS